MSQNCIGAKDGCCNESSKVHKLDCGAGPVIMYDISVVALMSYVVNHCFDSITAFLETLHTVYIGPGHRTGRVGA